MAIPPCTTGKHSTTDIPPPIEKTQVDESTAPIPAQAPSAGSLPLREAVSAPQPSATPPPLVVESESDDASQEIPDGRTCRRKGCGEHYVAGQNRGDEKCVYHPGAPLFHEGSKGYTCCKRRVLEFSEFMKIEGCKTKSRHLFLDSGKNKGVDDGSGEEKLETVRTDFYQTATTIIASFFLKKIKKENASVVFSSPTEISLDLPTSDVPPKRYTTVIPLFGLIDTEKSSFRILGTKLEVTLVKADRASWPVLRSDDRRTGEIIQVGKAGRAT